MRHVLLTGLLLLVAGPAPGAALSVIANDPQPGAGAQFAVSVEIDAASVSCFSFSVEYDAAVLTYLGAEEGALFSAAPEMTFFSDDVDGQGRPQPNDCLLGFETVVTGPGTIAVLHFEVLSAAPTSIALREAVLRDAARVPIPGVGDPTAWINTSATSTLPALGGGLSARPNPSSGATTLHFIGTEEPGAGRLLIYDLGGRLVRELDWPAGATRRQWDGRDGVGRAVANGIYLARLESDSRRAQTRIVRVR